MRIKRSERFGLESFGDRGDTCVAEPFVMTGWSHSHRFIRLVAAWLLLWFLVMAVPAPLPLAQVAEPCSAAGSDVAARPLDAAPSGAELQDEQNHAGHLLACADAQQPDVHAGHGAGAATHCPLCLHAAAPPHPRLAAAAPAIAPDDRTSAPPRLHLRVRSDAPPPARGPPRLS